MTSTKQLILDYLKQRPGFCSGTELENQASDWQTKASTISRRARELADEGKLERALSLGKPKTVQYKFKQPAMSSIQANSFLAGLPEPKVQGSLL